jgi:FlaA1/EpsC-like NDP-sugar epimerase
MAGVRLGVAVHVTFAALVFGLMVGTRLALLQVVLGIYRRGNGVSRVLVYGAGTTGRQIVTALRTHRDVDPVAFVDDAVALQGLTVAGLPVLTPLHIPEIVRERKIDRVLLAMPSQSPPRQARIARRLQKLGLEVQMLPSFSQLIGQEALIDRLQTVNPRAFLGRAEVDTPLGEETRAYVGRVVLVSGAGGSIGSELCRQVLECRPAKLVLLEQSEYGLYAVEGQLRTLARDAGVELVEVLGSVCDAGLVRRTLERHGVQVVLHAAAYKHVHLVQRNPLPGLANNVLGTRVLAQAALDAGCERFTLVSTDKAVRPRGVMGASKRLAEMVVQDLAARVPAGGCVLSMVRFGNVLGSSGSVVPLFHEQIQRGGPVTVTHPKVTRFFMTIQEAARLVLKAGAMAEGGEVFLLDMGEPVLIRDLARQAIEASGYAVRDEENPEGDIEIAYIGLREGEKLEEELFVDGSEKPTAHRKIFRVREPHPSQIEMAALLRALGAALEAGDEAAALEVVAGRIRSMRGDAGDGGAEARGAAGLGPAE